MVGAAPLRSAGACRATWRAAVDEASGRRRAVAEFVADVFGIHTDLGQVVVRLGLAILFGMAVGWEREVAEKPAGLKTHMLVALAASAVTLVAVEMVDTIGTAHRDVVRPDPSRVIEAVIAGVAFLGAGVIIRSRGNVRGITTGASVWLAGVLGLSCGAGYFAIAAVTTVLALITLTVIRAFEKRYIRRSGDED
jgi:putative Mg2+ transporter-C (MgtC) family protein